MIYQLPLTLSILNYFFRFLKQFLCFQDKVHSFQKGYLSSRSQNLFIYCRYMMPRTIKTGVVGPVLFSCYLVPLEVWWERIDVNYRRNADDTYLFLVYRASINLGACDLILTTLQGGLSGAKLRLNSNETAYMFISRKNILIRDVGLPADVNFSTNDTLLGFNLDSRLSYTKQVGSVCRSYYFLRKFYSIRDQSTENH